MHHLEMITPLILCYNEEANINRTLLQLYWAKCIIVVDSFSTDRTLSILSEHRNVVVFQRIFDTHAQQWNFGLEKIDTPWVLSLDADYWLPSNFIQTLHDWKQESQINGYSTPFKYCVFGKPLRSAILPPRITLFLKSEAKYIDDGHTQMLSIAGMIKSFPAAIYHDDRKSLSRWLWAQDRYAKLELSKFESQRTNLYRFNDWIRSKIILAPFIVFFYCLIIKGGVLDGWRGWYYAFQRMLAELLLSLHLLEARIINQETKK